MDNRLLIGFIVFLAAFLIFPIAMQKVRESQSPSEQSPAAEGQQPKINVAEIAELNQPPLLNEQNLVGSEWQVQVEQYKVKITLAAGGIGYATHPLAKAITGMDYLEGRWRVNYDQLSISTNFAGQEHSVTLKISGSNVYYIQGSKYEKVQRF